MIAVIVPAHNEDEHIGACLTAVNQASRSRLLLGEPVAMIVITDACTDRTGVIARRMGATEKESGARSLIHGGQASADVLIFVVGRDDDSDQFSLLVTMRLQQFAA